MLSSWYNTTVNKERRNDVKPSLSKVHQPNKYDFVLLSILIVMTLTSILAVYSALDLVTSETPAKLMMKHLIFIGIGYTAMGVIIYLGNDSIFDFAKIGYYILMIALVILLINIPFSGIFGRNLPFVLVVNGASSWYRFGFFSFQPSEFMKVVLIILTAGIIDEHNKNKVLNTFESDIELFIKVGKWAVPPMILTLLQPDTGVVIITGLSLVVMLLCSGIRKEWFKIGLIAVAVILGLFFFLFFFHYDFLLKFIDGYKLDRITAWFDPESYANGIGMQLYVSLLAIGSAGFTGHGIGTTVIAIPEAQNDFIFAVIGQTFGLIGTLFVIALCLILDLKLCKIAMNTTDTFDKYFICGFLGMLLYQQFQNMGMITGLLPITGITLPLISYGGSSLLSYMICFGIIMNASQKSNKVSNFV